MRAISIRGIPAQTEVGTESIDAVAERKWCGPDLELDAEGEYRIEFGLHERIIRERISDDVQIL